ncbi:helix-turn-helix transcriptional regulator [Methylomagnum sp.]
MESFFFPWNTFKLNLRKVLAPFLWSPTMQAEILIKPGDRFVRLPEVRVITGRSKSQIYADTTFPRPIKLSARESAWLHSEVLAWMQTKLEAARKNAA